MGRQSFRGLIHERVFHPSPGPVRQYQQSTSTDRTNHQRSHFTLRWSGDEADLLSVHQLSSTRYGAESKTTACNPTAAPRYHTTYVPSVMPRKFNSLLMRATVE
jgi:hypothetical protein